VQTYIDELSADLVERYKLHISTFLLDLGGEHEMLEFRFGYTLRHDSRLQNRTFKVGAGEPLADNELRAVIDVIFSEIETQIDESIASTLVELN
jgi:hypothetical protein